MQCVRFARGLWNCVRLQLFSSRIWLGLLLWFCYGSLTLATAQSFSDSASWPRNSATLLEAEGTPVALLRRLPAVRPVLAMTDVEPVSFLDLGGDGLVSGSGLFDNVSMFLGLDGSKQPQDFGINAQFGGRASVNWGIPIFEPWGIGAQVGTALDATGDAVQVVQRTQGSSGRTQSFTTVGMFQRTEGGLKWGVVYDFLAEYYYDSFSLAQWRFNIGYEVLPGNTIGVWSTICDHGDSAVFGNIPITLTPISQTNLYLDHEWAGGIHTMFWAGLANSHGQVNAVLGDLSRIKYPFVFGSQLNIPLTDRWALFGQGNFIMPASSGTVDSYLGLVFYPHGGARCVESSPFSPLQTVAAPTNFAVDLRR